MPTLTLPTLGYTSYGRRLTSANSDPCTYCSEPVEMASTSAGRGKMSHLKCKQANAPRTAPATCQECGASFQSVKRSDGRWTKCCSKSCNVQLQHAEGRPNIVYTERLTDEERKRREFTRGELARRKRRARLAGVPREPYTTALIAVRDGFTCSLCGGLVDMAIKWPDLQSPSVDHVIPISRGGDDTLLNVALAHFGCNVRKSNRT